MPRPSFKLRLVPLADRITPALSFASQQPFAAGASPVAVATGDFNSDGRLDVVTANGSDVAATVFTNNTPDGSLAPTFATSSFIVFPGATSVAVADFNGDGRPDVAVTNSASNSVTVVTNTTPVGAVMPTFGSPTQFQVPTDPRALAVGDFNGDGRPDLAVSAGSVWVLLNTTASGAEAAGFAAAQSITTGNRGSLAVADFNGDGRSDIAYAESTYIRGLGQYSNFVNVRTNTTPAGAASVTFAGHSNAYIQQFSSSAAAPRLTTADLTGNGLPGLVLDGIRVIPNTTTPGAEYATFGGVREVGYAAGPTGRAVAADLDGDGRVDLAVPSNGNTASAATNTTPPSNPNPTFQTEGGVFVGQGPVAIAAGDFNGDGRIDLVTANAGDGSISVLANTTATATATTPSVVGQFGGPADGAGVWRMNGSTGNWDQITAANADALATAPNGRVVGNFGGNGVWYYNPAHGWTQINGNRATALAMDAAGNVYASFPGFGVAIFRLANGWSAPLTGIAADLLAVSPSGELAVSFSGYGVYRHTLIDGWRLVTENRTATALVIAANGDVVANFAGSGLYRHRPSAGWARLNSVEATTFAVGTDGEVVANFAGFGMARYVQSANWWQPLTAPPGVNGAPVSLAADLFGSVFASFGGSGVWEYDPFAGWRLRTGSVPGLLAVGR